jgi:hypothetical protein
MSYWRSLLLPRQFYAIYKGEYWRIESLEAIHSKRSRIKECIHFLTCSLHHLETGSGGTHSPPTSGYLEPEREATTRLHLVPRSRMYLRYLHVPIRPDVLLTYRGNFPSVHLISLVMTPCYEVGGYKQFCRTSYANLQCWSYKLNSHIFVSQFSIAD